MRFTTIAAVAAVAVLTACTESRSSLPQTSSAACRSHASQTASSVARATTTAPQVATAAQLGLWPREGPSMRVCGDVGEGYARCQAWLRTDIRGAIKPNTPGGYAPVDLQTAYGLTSDSKINGSNETVAIVDAYDDPNVASDLSAYRARYGLPACTVASGCLTKQSYTSETNAGWAGEESVDVDMVSAICPNCKILLVEAASASMGDLSAAEQYATTHADYVSNSWSGDEGTTTFDDDYKTGCGVIVAATGDNGHNATAQWPAILPSVIAVGGTELRSVSPRAETAWLRGGSGCSKVYAKPAFQSNLNTACSMRAEADVAADADPHTGVAVYDSFHQAGWVVFGGTSVATPIVAATFALAGATNGNPLENLYSHTANLNDVTSGSDGTCGAPLCVAGQGWDGPTGLGSPKGTSAL
ncbi:MAG TPA: S8 family serine peptidase [Candidatus Cybelea sp.]|nr:S8 family serine peptidase [Candidatus Cybelea sp.]